MPLYSAGAAGLLRPEEVAALIVEPVGRASVAMQVTSVVTTEAYSLRIPKITSDVSALWVNEGSEITPSDMGVDEIDRVPEKLAALSIISNE